MGEKLLNPVETPWIVLLRSLSDNAYLSTMGVTVAPFQKILTDGFTARWETAVIHRMGAGPVAILGSTVDHWTLVARWVPF